MEWCIHARYQRAEADMQGKIECAPGCWYCLPCFYPGNFSLQIWLSLHGMDSSSSYGARGVHAMLSDVLAKGEDFHLYKTFSEKGMSLNLCA